MECLPKNRILHFRPNTLTLVRELVNLNSQKRLNDAVDLLLEWIQKQSHFLKKDFPREYLERAIVVSKGSVERAKRKLEKTCTYRTLLPDLFEFSNPRDMTKEYENNMISFILPQVTENHDRVFVLRNTGKKFSSFTNYYKFFLMNQIPTLQVLESLEGTVYPNFCVFSTDYKLVCEYFLTNDYSNGVIALLDYQETIVLEILKVMNLAELRHVLTIITEAFSLRVKGIHFITSSRAIDTLVSMVKQVLSEKIAKRIHVHKDFATLKDYIPLEILPIEYGGKEKSVHELQDNLYDELASPEFTAHLQEMRSARTDESKRHPDSLHDVYKGMPGSFRSLCVD